MPCAITAPSRAVWPGGGKGTAGPRGGGSSCRLGGGAGKFAGGPDGGGRSAPESATLHSQPSPLGPALVREAEASPSPPVAALYDRHERSRQSQTRAAGAERQGTVSATPAGWYADPTNRHELRYWDGESWTADVSDSGRSATDPLAEPGEPTADLRPVDLDDERTQTSADETEPGIAPSIPAVGPTPLNGAPGRARQRTWPWILVAAVLALIVGTAIGAAASANDSQVDDLKKELAAVRHQRDAAQEKVDDREAQRRAALAKVAADKAAREESQRKAQESAAAAAKRQADAQAAAAAAAAAEAAKKDTFSGDGVRGVGAEINPGVWHTDGGVGNCYYAILNSTDTSDIADNNNTSGPASVTLAAGKYFETSGCADWRRTG
jgi:hypothetical protein